MNAFPLIMGILFAMTVLFHGIGEGMAEKNRYTYVDMAAKTAVRASLEEEAWDLPATANAGVIVLDEYKAKQIAEDRFLSNQDIVGIVDVHVINNAPYTFTYNGKMCEFQSNGVALTYTLDNRTWIRCGEVDDYN